MTLFLYCPMHLQVVLRTFLRISNMSPLICEDFAKFLVLTSPERASCDQQVASLVEIAFVGMLGMDLCKKTN